MSQLPEMAALREILQGT